MKKKFLLSFLLIISLLFSAVAGSKKVYAFSGSCSVSATPNSCDPGAGITISYTITADGQFAADWTVSVNGTQIAHDYNGNIQGSCSGTYSYTASTEGNNTITLTCNIASYDVDPQTLTTPTANPTASCIVHVSTAEERQKAADEAAKQASIQKAEEEERQRQAAEAASIQASKDAVDASIREEQQKAASVKAASEEAENASIAESASIEQSVKEESESIEESLKEAERLSEKESLAEARSIEESVSMSESEVEKTRAKEIGELKFVPYEYKKQKFFFAVKDLEIPEIPEDYYEAELVINTQEVFALQGEKFAEGTFIVYGMAEEKEEPEFFIYDSETETFLEFDKIFGGNVLSKLTGSTGSEEEPASSDAVSENGNRSGLSAGMTLLLIILAAIFGAVIAGIIFLLVSKRNGENNEADMFEETEGYEDLPEDQTESEEPEADEADALTEAFINGETLAAEKAFPEETFSAEEFLAEDLSETDIFLDAAEDTETETLEMLTEAEEAVIDIPEEETEVLENLMENEP